LAKIAQYVSGSKTLIAVLDAIAFALLISCRIVCYQAPGQSLTLHRRRELERVLQQHFKADANDPAGSCREAKAASETPAFPGAGISRHLLDRGLLMGLGSRRRKESLRRMKERDRDVTGKFGIQNCQTAFSTVMFRQRNKEMCPQEHLPITHNKLGRIQ